MVASASGDAGLGVRYSGSVLPWARPLGITWAVGQIDWRQISPKKGIYEWGQSDQMMSSGLKTLCFVIGWPSWLGSTVDMGAARSFLNLLAKRYHKEASAYEAWDNQFALPGTLPALKEEDLNKLSTTAADALGSPLANHGGLKVARIGFRQPAAPMGNCDPGNLTSPLYAKRVQEKDGSPQVAIWPWTLFPEKRSAILQVWNVLKARATGTDIVVLACPPDEYYPEWNNSDGTPSQQGIALAALASSLAGASSVQELVAPEGFQMFQITRPGAEIVTVLGRKSPDNVTARIDAKGKIKARDWQGNPVGFAPDSIPLDESPLYLLGKIEPAQLELRK